MKLKNSTAEIFGSTYNINYVDTIEPDEEGSAIDGMCESIKRKITIATRDFENKDVDKHDLTRVLFHELLHAILNEGQYFHASADEPMVEWMARCLTSLKEQKVI